MVNYYLKSARQSSPPRQDRSITPRPRCWPSAIDQRIKQPAGDRPRSGVYRGMSSTPSTILADKGGPVLIGGGRRRQRTTIDSVRGRPAGRSADAPARIAARSHAMTVTRQNVGETTADGKCLSTKR